MTNDRLRKIDDLLQKLWEEHDKNYERIARLYIQKGKILEGLREDAERDEGTQDV